MDDEDTEGENGVIMNISTLVSEAAKSSKTTDEKAKEILAILAKFGTKVDEIDWRQTSYSPDIKLSVKAVLRYRILLVGNPEQFMQLKKYRKLYNVEMLAEAEKKVLLCLILTITEMKTGEMGDEKVTSLLHLASLLFYSTI